MVAFFLSVFFTALASPVIIRFYNNVTGGHRLRILLIYPEYPDTFWSFRHALKIVNKKASFPPLGLATIAAMLPKEWEKKLVDMSVQPLTDKDIRWADYVFISAMVIQRESVNSIIPRIHRLGKKVVAGGPLFSMGYELTALITWCWARGRLPFPSFSKTWRRETLGRFITRTPGRISHGRPSRTGQSST
jgi:hypothetical protein